MSGNYDIDHELEDAIEEALEALRDVPEVGQRYDPEYRDAQRMAYLRLKDAMEKTDVF